MNSASPPEQQQQKKVNRAVIFLALTAACFYFGFIIATGMKG